ncbi:hypothetical protein LAZ67_5004545 [Cordylochernes scorpioides]|uniref:Transposase n=1 Tax=Cordylochernes scorpioides TaxID=51811 RepID=A0ABY6KJY8_9ARAC|nr:hypothetical protein LAZ67_5004545 [Cordylochernes scorpioides]
MDEANFGPISLEPILFRNKRREGREGQQYNNQQTHPHPDARRSHVKTFSGKPSQVFEGGITCDETWIYHYDPSSKHQSMKWTK